MISREKGQVSVRAIEKEDCRVKLIDEGIPACGSNLAGNDEARHGAGYLRVRTEACFCRRLEGNYAPSLVAFLGLILQLLRASLDSLRPKCTPSRAKDILMLLPVELSEMVLSYLSFRDIV